MDPGKSKLCKRFWKTSSFLLHFTKIFTVKIKTNSQDGALNQIVGYVNMHSKNCHIQKLLLLPSRKVQRGAG